MGVGIGVGVDVGVGVGVEINAVGSPKTGGSLRDTRYKTQVAATTLDTG